MANDNTGQWFNRNLLSDWLKTIEAENDCTLQLTHSNTPLLPQALSPAETTYAQHRFDIVIPRINGLSDSTKAPKEATRTSQERKRTSSTCAPKKTTEAKHSNNGNGDNAINYGNDYKGLDTPRAQQWLLGRSALKALGDNDAPTQFPHPHYSVSHCDGWAVALKATHGTKTTNVGIDVERFRPLATRAAYYYLQPPEVEALAGLTADEQYWHRLRLWTAKEALFKADPLNGSRVMKSYRIHNPLARYSEASNNGGQVSKVYTLSTGEPHQADMLGVWFMAIALLQSPLQA
jgi:hypothetical protein